MRHYPLERPAVLGGYRGGGGAIVPQQLWSAAEDQNATLSVGL